MTNIRIYFEREKAKNVCFIDQIVIESKRLEVPNICFGHNCQNWKIDL